MTARVLLVDNYDSFTYNLAQAFQVLGAEVLVHRNDQIDVDAARGLAPTHLCVSPGPGRPEDAGNAPAILAALATEVPVLGVCLGHQMIGHVFGGAVVRAPRLMHGKSSLIRHDGQGVFDGCPQPMQVARYHSLCVAREGLPDTLTVTAETIDHGEVMGLRHRDLQVHGVQFHPESVLTPDGQLLLGAFLRLT
ncbi:MAG TPA: aminodeoxychorismate/anthranilate synthase component II [Myxococcota bacterium]|nr:aminodeoxychorismate/anthranilate synthase component II [Myxococcota bacterium]